MYQKRGHFDVELKVVKGSHVQTLYLLSFLLNESGVVDVEFFFINHKKS